MSTPKDLFQTASGRTEAVDFSPLTGGPADPSGPMKNKVHKTGRPTLDHGSRPLTKKQIIVLAQLARAAYDFQAKLSLVDDLKFTDWRHREQLTAVGQSSLKDCRQHHYVHLRGHFLALRAGTPSPSAFKDLTATADNADVQGNLQLLREAIAGLSQASNIERPAMGPQGAENYVLAIARNQAKGIPPKTLDDIANSWPARKIETLIWTVRNRTSAINRTGLTSNRNKSQRKPR